MMFPISEYMVGAVDGSEEFFELMIVKDMMRNKMAWAGQSGKEKIERTSATN